MRPKIFSHIHVQFRYRCRRALQTRLWGRLKAKPPFVICILVYARSEWFDIWNLFGIWTLGFGILRSAPQTFLFGCGYAAPRVTCAITNSGKRAGAEVAQVYVRPPKDTPVERPQREVKGHARVSLEPGGTKRVEIPLPPDAFSRHDGEKRAWVDDPGECTIEISASSRDIKARLPFQKQAALRRPF